MKKLTRTIRFLSLLGINSVSLFRGKRDESVAATVGNYRISFRDAELRDEVIRTYFPEEKLRLGLEQLIRAYEFAEVLREYSLLVTDEILRKEEARIAQTTLMPEKLERIKAIFGEDREAYRRVYVLPVFVERTIYYDLFLKEPTIHAESRRKAQHFLESVLKTPKEFIALAKIAGHKAFRLLVSLADGVTPELPQSSFDRGPAEAPISPIGSGAGRILNERTQKLPSEEGKQWIEEVIQPLNRGEVFGRLINRRESWLVVRYVGRSKDQYLLEAVCFQKKEFSEWVEQEARKVNTYRASYFTALSEPQKF